MMQSILQSMDATRRRLGIHARNCLEIGSRDVNGTPRSVFTDAKFYWGIDLEPGPGVDQVGDAEIILRDMPAGKFDTIICCETLEHTVRPWVIVSLMREILTPGGYLWISAPTYGFPLHRYPIDCYRFADDAYRLWLFAGMILLSVETVKDELGQPAIVAAGQKWPLFG